MLTNMREDESEITNRLTQLIAWIEDYQYVRPCNSRFRKSDKGWKKWKVKLVSNVLFPEHVVNCTWSSCTNVYSFCSLSYRELTLATHLRDIMPVYWRVPQPMNACQPFFVRVIYVCVCLSFAYHRQLHYRLYQFSLSFFSQPGCLWAVGETGHLFWNLSFP